MFFIKIHKSYRDVIAICDSELLGKKFEEGKFQLDVRENFYNGREVDEKELERIIIRMAKEDATFNIVGKKAVNIALKAGLIEKQEVREIQKIPFALMLL